MGFKTRISNAADSEYPARLTEFFARADEHAKKKLPELHHYCRFAHTKFSDDTKV